MKRYFLILAFLLTSCGSPQKETPYSQITSTSGVMYAYDGVRIVELHPDGVRSVYAPFLPIRGFSVNNDRTKVLLNTIDPDQITIVDLRTGKETPIVKGIYGSMNRDGTLISYQKAQAGVAMVIVKNLSTGAEETIAKGTRGTFSPDSQYLAVEFSDTGETIGVKIINMKTHTVVFTIPNAVDPTWSPDGSRIAYRSQKTVEGKATLTMASFTGDSVAQYAVDPPLELAWINNGIVFKATVNQFLSKQQYFILNNQGTVLSYP